MGHVATGTLADLVLWKPENFGAKPEMVLKSGVIAWAQVRYYHRKVKYLLIDTLIQTQQMGDANASIPSVQPFYSKPMWGSKQGSAAINSVVFVSQLSVSTGVIASYGLSKRAEPVRGCRSVSKKDMKWNDATPEMKVDPENYEVRADGELADIAPAQVLPLARGYNLF